MAWAHEDGLERTFRALQALVQISVAICSTVILDATRNGDLRRALVELSGRFGLIRRFFRLFRFFDSFTSSYNTFLSLQAQKDQKPTPSPSPAPFLETTLDGLAATFNGFYLLLEAVTIIDALGIPELVICGPELEYALKIESQRCWLIALCVGAFACIMRLWKMEKHLPVKPEVGSDTAKQKKVAQYKVKTAQQWRLWRKMTACLLDMALPGSVTGLIPVSKSMVAVIMLTTSLMTGFDVWERCGREVGRA